MNQEQSPRMSVPFKGNRLNYRCYLLPPEFDPEQLYQPKNRTEIDRGVSDALNVKGLTSHLYEISPEVWVMLFFHAGQDRNIKTYDREKLEPGVQRVTPRSVACVYFSWRASTMYVHVPAKAELSTFFTAFWPLFPGRRSIQAFEQIIFNVSGMGLMTREFRIPAPNPPSPWKHMALRMAKYRTAGEHSKKRTEEWDFDGFEEEERLPPGAWRRILELSLDVNREGRGRPISIKIKPKNSVINVAMDATVVNVLDVFISNVLDNNRLLTPRWGCA